MCRIHSHIFKYAQHVLRTQRQWLTCRSSSNSILSEHIRLKFRTAVCCLRSAWDLMSRIYAKNWVKMWLEGLYCESLRMSAERLRKIWKSVCVWFCSGVTCVDVMAAAMHRCSHQGESKQTWQQHGKKYRKQCSSTLPLVLFLTLSFLCLPLLNRFIFKHKLIPYL